MTDTKNMAITSCGHFFCFSCIARSLQENVNCPMCRTELVPKIEKVFTRDEHLSEMDSSYQEGYQEGQTEMEPFYHVEMDNSYQEGFQEGLQEGQTRAETEWGSVGDAVLAIREERDLEWQTHLDEEVQRNYERGIVQGRSLANEDLQLMREQLKKLRSLFAMQTETRQKI